MKENKDGCCGEDAIRLLDEMGKKGIKFYLASPKYKDGQFMIELKVMGVQPHNNAVILEQKKVQTMQEYAVENNIGMNFIVVKELKDEMKA